MEATQTIFKTGNYVTYGPLWTKLSSVLSVPCCMILHDL